MSINDRVKKAIEDLKSKLEYSTNEYNKAVMNYGEQSIQAIYSKGEITALEYVIEQLDKVVFDRNKWQQKYREKHRQEAREYSKKYKQEHKDKVSEYNKRYREKQKAKDKSE